MSNQADEDFCTLVVGLADPKRDCEILVNPADYQRIVRVGRKHAYEPTSMRSEMIIGTMGRLSGISVVVVNTQPAGTVSFCPPGRHGSRHIVLYRAEVTYKSRFERDFEV